MTFDRKAYMKAYMKAYRQRPEVKAYRKAYNQRPEMKARMKAYYQRPEVKARMKARKLELVRQRNLQIFIEKSKTAPPDSLFSSDRKVLEALALDGVEFDRLWKSHAHRKNAKRGDVDGRGQAHVQAH